MLIRRVASSIYSVVTTCRPQQLEPAHHHCMPDSDHSTPIDVLREKVKETGLSKLSSDDLSLLVSCFIAPDNDASSLEAKAYVTLSTICGKTRQAQKDDQDASTADIVNKFFPHIENKLRETEEQPLLEAITFILALFTVDSHSAVVIFCRDGVQSQILDTLELYPSSQALSRAIGSLLAQACGYKECRMALTPECAEWLDNAMRRKGDVNLLASAALSQVKRALAKKSDTYGGAISEQQEYIDFPTLLQTSKSVLFGLPEHSSSTAETIEAIAYLSSIPPIKEVIVSDSSLIRKLISLRPRILPRDQRNESDEQIAKTLCYGLAVIFANLCSYRPQLSEEQAQMKKLQQAAEGKAAKAEADADSKYDDDDRVKRRCQILLEAKVTELLAAISKLATRPALREMVGKAFLGLVTEPNSRGKVLRDGGSKALMTIIHSALEDMADTVAKPLTARELPARSMLPTDLPAVQALAKLCITSSPLQVFGPDESRVKDAIRPLAALLVDQSSLLLQVFEALMALTNLAGVGPENAKRVADSDGVTTKLDLILIDDNEMVRRAATELICNLISGCEDVFNKYAGEGSDVPSGTVNSRLHILITLADVADVPTRLAASGALAVLTESPSACFVMYKLQEGNPVYSEIFKHLIVLPREEKESTSANDTFGLLHRGIICSRNLLLNQTDPSVKKKVAELYERAGMIKVLADVGTSVVDDSSKAVVLRPIAETLSCMKESGVNLTF